MDFTVEYFKEELIRFRDVMGNRAIMSNEAKRDRALGGFTMVYLNTQTFNEKDKEFVSSMFRVTVDEFNKRAWYMTLHAA
jgi:hypothetical protein